MSTFSNVHAIQEFVSGVSVPLENNVLIVSRGNAKSKTVSICASVPEIQKHEVISKIDELFPHIIDVIETAQAKIIRAAHTAGAVEITSEKVSLNAVIEFLNEEAASSRLTKEQIVSYLNEPEQKELLKVAFAEALKYSENLTGDQIEKLNKMHKAFCDSAAELSGSRTLWEEKKQNTMRKYITLLDDSAMKDRLVDKISGMKDKKEKEEDLLAVL